MKLQAAFNAAMGQAISVYAVVINGILVIAKIGEYHARRTPDTVLLSNNPLIQADMVFRYGDFQAALSAYQWLMSSKKCVIQQDLAQYRLDNVIDYAGHKDSGEEKFNIAELKNGHWAILAICWYTYRQMYGTQQFDKAMGFFDDLEMVKQNIWGSVDGDFFMTV